MKNLNDCGSEFSIIKLMAVKCPNCDETHLDVNEYLVIGEDNKIDCEFCGVTFIVGVDVVATVKSYVIDDDE